MEFVINLFTGITCVVLAVLVVVGLISLFESWVNTKFYDYEVTEKEKEEAEE
jgi:hypothetical protein